MGRTALPQWVYTSRNGLCVDTHSTSPGLYLFPRTASRLKKLSYYAIESMVLPTICAALAIILKATRPEGVSHGLRCPWKAVLC